MTHVVDKLFRSREIHLINGASGSGKSTWLCQFLKDFQAGADIFGEKSHPVPWTYIAFDRGPNEINSLMDKVGLERTPNQVISLDEEPIVKLTDLHKYGTGDLIIVEALASIMKDGKAINDYSAVRFLCAHLKKWLRSTNKTLIATTHDGKTREGKEVKWARERMIGSVAWGAFTSTSLTLEKVQDKPNNRFISLDCREFQVSQMLKFNDAGLLVLDDGGEDDDLVRYIEDSIQGGSGITTNHYYSMAETFGIQRRTAERRLQQFVDDGLLIPDGRDGKSRVYRKFTSKNQQLK